MTDIVSCAALRHLVIVSESWEVVVVVVVSVSVCAFVSGVSNCFSGFCPGLDLDLDLDLPPPPVVSPPETAVECRRKGLNRSVLTL